MRKLIKEHNENNDSFEFAQEEGPDEDSDSDSWVINPLII
jgi:hypothetical protein